MLMRFAIMVTTTWEVIPVAPVTMADGMLVVSSRKPILEGQGIEI